MKQALLAFWRSVTHSPSTIIGSALVALHLLIAIFAPLLAPMDPITPDRLAVLSAPGGGHLLGTDRYGYDILSRVIYGGRYALSLSIIAALCAVGVGTVLGTMVGVIRGWLEEVVMRLVDAILSVPSILSLLVVVSMLGSGPPIIVLAATVIYFPAVTRVVRAATLNVAGLDYVTAARARGERVWAIMRREVLPNILDVVMVEFAMRASWIVLLISALSFLGFGANPPTPDWGLMVAENRDSLSIVPWATAAPIIALASLVIGFNLVADGMAKARGVDRAVSAGATG